MRNHVQWMQFACTLAQGAVGQTSPNPMVGSVVVKNGYMLGQGAHLKAGTPHAEVHALQMAGEDANGSSLYVTLEPCNHHGRTPPCTEFIIKSGVKQVVIGSIDPDKLVSGQGIARLREAGIEVIEGILQGECSRLNEAYFHHRQTGKPFVTLKTATTLDGKIATVTGDSKWITGETSRKFVHELRHQHDAILVGIGTIMADNPFLTTRLESGGKNPLRIIVDSKLSIPLDVNVVDTKKTPTWIFTTENKESEKEKRLREKGVKVISTGTGPKVDWEFVLSYLGKNGILSLFVEGGGAVNASLLQENRIQKVISFIAPKLLGGKGSPTSMEGENPTYMKEAKTLHNVTWNSFGEDICIIGYLKGE